MRRRYLLRRMLVVIGLIGLLSGLSNSATAATYCVRLRLIYGVPTVYQCVVTPSAL